MDRISNRIETLGFEKCFLENIDPADLDKFDIARVTVVHKDSYIIHNGKNEMFAELIGKMVFSANSPMDYPAVGDWVLATFFDEDTFSVIHNILPRKSLLKRKTPGKKIAFQLIAANIDTALIVQSMGADFNLRRLERYLVMAKASNIKPVVLLSKSDLMAGQAVADRVAKIHGIMPFLAVHPFSNENRSGLNKIKELLLPGQTYCLLGSSGVGKTTLLNNLIGKSVFTTKTVREKDSKGRHATTSRQLITLDCRAMVIDTPGMRELGNFSVETGMDEIFPEIITLSKHCQFNDCTHVNEKGCAVIEAVETGQLLEKRYQNYIKMNKESAYYEMSYLEKKQKDKLFGKLCKTVMKHKKHRR